MKGEPQGEDLAQGFDELTGSLFTRDELIDYPCKALSELDGTADAGCENTVPDGRPTCGHCASCSAAKLLDEIDAETKRRVAAAKAGPEVSGC